MADYAAVLASLEAVAERGDPEAAIYARLFADHPGTEALFFLDRDGGRRAHMLSRTFDTLFDYVGERRWAPAMLQCELINHQELGVEPAVFMQFFVVLRDVVRGELGEAWTQDYTAGWGNLLGELDAVMSE